MAERTKVGRVGHVAGYDVLILNDRIYVVHEAANDGGGEAWTHAVPNHGTAIGDLAERPASASAGAGFPMGRRRCTSTTVTTATSGTRRTRPGGTGRPARLSRED